MEMHAYSEDYLLTAQRILGDMLDYAVNEYEFVLLRQERRSRQICWRWRCLTLR